VALQVGVFADNLGLGVREGIRKASEIGADGIQIFTTRGEMLPENLGAAQRRELRDFVASLGLVLSATCSDFGHGLVDEAHNRVLLPQIKANIDLAVDLGTRIITTHIGRVPENRSDPIWGVLARALNEIGAYAEQRGVALATETGPEPGSTLAELLEALDTKAIRVNFDPANFIIYGYDYQQALQDLGPYIVHTHAKDAAVGKGEVPLGQGDVAWPWYIATLQSLGFDGFYTIEREAGPDPLGDVRQAIAFLRSF
jgi:L-ribulose-5-phosphate 3-epimerase